MNRISREGRLLVAHPKNRIAKKHFRALFGFRKAGYVYFYRLENKIPICTARPKAKGAHPIVYRALLKAREVF